MYHVLVKRNNPAPLATIKQRAATAFEGSLDDEDRAALNALYKWSATGKFSEELATQGLVARIPYGKTYADIVLSMDDETTGLDLFANIPMLLNDYPELLQDLGVELIETGGHPPIETTYPAYEVHK